MVQYVRAAAMREAKPGIRQARKADHCVIREMLRVAYQPYAAQVAPEVFDRFLDDLLDLDRHARDGQLLIAELDGKIAGYAAYYPDASAQGVGWPPGWASGYLRALQFDLDINAHYGVHTATPWTALAYLRWLSQHRLPGTGVRPAA